MLCVGVPFGDDACFTPCGDACADHRELQAPIKVQSDFVYIEVPVFGFGKSAFGHVETFGECSWAVKVAVGVLVVGEYTVALPTDAGSFFFVVAVQAETENGFNLFLVGPAEAVFVFIHVVEIEIGPAVA